MIGLNPSDIKVTYAEDANILNPNLQKAAEEETITEDKAQQIRDWQNSQPEAMSKMGGLL